MPRSRLLAPTVLLAVLGLALRTRSPGLTGGDSGELLLAAWGLGIAHNPGYPLFVQLGHAVQRLLPLGDAASRVGLLSGLGSAAAAALVALGAGRLGTRPALAGLAGLLIGAAPVVWEVATGIEVYGLHAALAGAILYAGLAARGPRAPVRWRGCQALLAGLALAHHISILLVLPGLVLPTIGGRRPRAGGRRSGAAVLAACAFALGVSPYLALPVRAARAPVVNEGRPDVLGRFLDHAVLARTHFRLLAGQAVSETQPPGPRSLATARHLARQLPAAAWLTVLAGLALGGRRLRALVGLTVLGNATYIIFLNPVPFEVTSFGLPAVLVLGLAAGVGAERILRRVPRLGPATAVALAVSALAAALGEFADHDLSADLVPRLYSQGLLASVPPQGRLVPWGDSELFLARARQVIERDRLDVKLLSRPHTIVKQFDLEDLPTPGRPLFSSDQTFRPLPHWTPGSRHGLVFRHPPDRLDEAADLDRWARLPEIPVAAALPADYESRVLLGRYLRRRATALWCAGRRAEATADLDRAERATPAFPIDLAAAGQELIEAGLVERGWAYLEQAHAREPGLPGLEHYMEAVVARRALAALSPAPAP